MKYNTLMKALVLVAHNRLELQEWPLPEIGPEEVLVKVAACGICGSDVHGMDGSSGRRRPPIIMGHEAAGTVFQKGSGVTDWSEGERVTFDSLISCGECWFCRCGRSNLCDRRRVPGVACEEFRCHGAFAEYVAVPRRVLYRIPDALDFRRAAMVEPVAIAMHAVRRMKICLNDVAIVVGTGVIGLLAVEMLRAAGCGTIIAVDLDQRRLDLACKLGADVGLRSDTGDVCAEVMRCSGHRGADVAIEAVGIGPTVQLAAQCLRKGGQLSLVGILAPDVAFPLQDVVVRELSLHGSYCSCGEYPACLDMMASGAIKVDSLITPWRLWLTARNGFSRLQTGKEGLLKVILEPQS